MTSIFVNILIFVRNKYYPLGMQRVKVILSRKTVISRKTKEKLKKFDANMPPDFST